MIVTNFIFSLNARVVIPPKDASAKEKRVKVETLDFQDSGDQMEFQVELQGKD